MLILKLDKIIEEEVMPMNRSFLKELAYCPLNNIMIDDITFMPENIESINHTHIIRRYYINAKELEDIFKAMNM